MTDQQSEKGHHAAGEEDVAETDRVSAVRGQMALPQVVELGDNGVRGGRNQDRDPNPRLAGNAGKKFPDLNLNAPLANALPQTRATCRFHARFR